MRVNLVACGMSSGGVSMMESSWHEGTEAKLSRLLVVEIEERPVCKSSSRCIVPTPTLDMLVFEGAPDTSELLCGCYEISSNPLWSLEEMAELTY